MTDYSSLLQKQADFFKTGFTLDLSFRKKQLTVLYNAIKSNEKKIHAALSADLKKPEFEAYATETGFTLNEIRFLKKKLHTWIKPKRVRTPLIHFKGKSIIYPEPYGQSLIFATWNYPVQMVFVPMAGAIAAGNTVIVKPSEYSSATSKLMEEIISEIFPEEFVACVNGGVKTGQALLELPFNHIFFTGSYKVGRIVMKKAAENLTPLTLEMGGKNPCIVDETAKIDRAAKKIVWGKFLNAGQTCISPDYLFVQEKVADELIENLISYTGKFFGEDPQKSHDFGRIINYVNFERLENLLKDKEILLGGTMDRQDLYISPTLVLNPPIESELMKEEIFGPILPIFKYREKEEVVKYAKTNHKPLSIYIFSSSKSTQKYFLKNIQSGNGAINETLMQIANSHLPFGGVNSSGMGSYHGEYSFKNFSHYRPIIKKATWFDLPIVYPPYTNFSLNVLKKFLR
jgi:aldehyde dehydrogenase (NAD+)